eukprot:1188067-Prorocentrum_minimum.AAC.1
MMWMLGAMMWMLGAMVWMLEDVVERLTKVHTPQSKYGLKDETSRPFTQPISSTSGPHLIRHLIRASLATINIHLPCIVPRL